MSDAISPAFDAGGKYLYFLASTDYGPQTGWLEMSSIDRPVRRAIYLAVLPAERAVAAPAGDRRRTGRPLRPRAHGPIRPAVRIDFAGIGQRILALNVPAGDYSRVSSAGPAGTIFYTEPHGRGRRGRVAPPDSATSSRSAPPRRFSRAIRSYTLSGDRKKLLYQAGRRSARWGIVGTDRPGTRRRRARSTSRSSRRGSIRAPSGRRSSARRGASSATTSTTPKMHGADWKAVFARYTPAPAIRRPSRRPRLPHRDRRAAS